MNFRTPSGPMRSGRSLGSPSSRVAHRLMVNPKQQGKRIGRDLMRFAENWARAKGYSAIRLDAFSANPRALRLYGGLGYRDSGGASFRKGPFRCFEKELDRDAG